MDELHWYVVRIISGQERKVKTYLENELEREKLQSFVPQVVIPTEKVYEIRAGKKVMRERNKLPGYILIQANLKSNGEVIPLVNNIPGIIGFLGSEKKKVDASQLPEALRPNEVTRLMGDQDPLDEVEHMETPFIVGETVKVMDGAFNGFTGTVEAVFEDKKKLNVMVKIFGRNTPVELNYAQVEKED